MNGKIFKLLVTFLLGVVFVLPCANVNAVEQLTMGTTNSSSSHYTYFVSVSQVINEAVPEVQVTAVESGAARENAQRIISGAFDLGLSDTVTSYVVYNGLENWEGKANKNFRWLWSYTSIPLLIFVRQDSDVKKISDLKGKKFAPAQVGSSAGKITTNVFEAIGVKPQYHMGSYSDGVDAVKNKQIVGMAKPSAGTNNPDAAIMEVQATVPLNFLSFSDAELEKIAVKYPYYTKLTLQKNVFKDQSEKVQTVGFAPGCITLKTLSADLVYKMVKAVVEGQQKVSSAYPAVKDIDYIQMTLDTATVPLHAGAIKYFEEQGHKVPERLMPPEYTR